VSSCHLSHEDNVEQVFSRAGNLSDPNMDPEYLDHLVMVGVNKKSYKPSVRRRPQPRTPTTTPNDPPPPRRDATTDVLTALRAEPSAFAPFIRSQKSRTCNAVSIMSSEYWSVFLFPVK
jgi:hypothetical protein